MRKLLALFVAVFALSMLVGLVDFADPEVPESMLTAFDTGSACIELEVTVLKEPMEADTVTIGDFGQSITALHGIGELNSILPTSPDLVSHNTRSCLRSGYGRSAGDAII